MPDSSVNVGAESGSADTTGASLTPEQEAQVFGLIGQGMSMAQALIIALGGGQQPAPTTGATAEPTVLGAFEQRVTFDWAANWPIVAAVGGLGLLLVLRR